MEQGNGPPSYKTNVTIENLESTQVSHFLKETKGYKINFLISIEVHRP